MRVFLTALLGASLVAALPQAAQAAPPGYHSPRRFYTPRHQLYHRPPVRLALGANLAHYNGDLTNTVKDNTYHLGLSIGLAQSLSPHLTFGADVGYNRLQAIDHFPQRGLRFESTNYFATTFLRYNLFADKTMYAGLARQETPFQVFVQAGVGGMFFNPTASQSTPTGLITLQPERQGGYPQVAALLPIGGGITLQAGRGLRFTLEGLYYFSSSDLLDDVSVRANPNTNDDFATVALKLEFAFYKKKGRPLIHND